MYYLNLFQNIMKAPIKKDKCVLCECETPYYIDERVENRRCYIEGAGQLCRECWNEIYNNKERREK